MQGGRGVHASSVFERLYRSVSCLPPLRDVPASLNTTKRDHATDTADLPSHCCSAGTAYSAATYHRALDAAPYSPTDTVRCASGSGDSEYWSGGELAGAVAGDIAAVCCLHARFALVTTGKLRHCIASRLTDTTTISSSDA